MIHTYLFFFFSGVTCRERFYIINHFGVVAPAMGLKLMF